MKRTDPGSQEGNETIEKRVESFLSKVQSAKSGVGSLQFLEYDDTEDRLTGSENWYFHGVPLAGSVAALERLFEGFVKAAADCYGIDTVSMRRGVLKFLIERERKWSKTNDN